MSAPVSGDAATGSTAAALQARPITVGIDARAASEVLAGRGRYVRELLSALSRRGDVARYRLYARAPWSGGLDSRFAWHLCSLRDPWWHVAVARDASRHCDVFLSTNSYLTPLLLRVPSAVVVHDLVAFELPKEANRRSLVIERLTLGGAVRRAGALIANSESTGRDLARRFPHAASRLTVAPLGVPGWIDDGLDEGALDALPQPGFVLAVGTLEPRKNLPRLVEAYERLPAPLRAQHPLVVVGGVGWQAGDTTAALSRLGADCRLLGRVSDEVLTELYRRCAVFCYPSLYEGFGLPVLEAMAAGAAVLTSPTSSLPEVGGEAVAYAPPTDVAGIAEALSRLLENPERRANLGRAARERARTFSWDRTAEATLTAVRRAARGG